MERKTRLAKKANYGSSRTTKNVKYIVIHYTANDGDSDEGNANYFANNTVYASAHYFVDDDSVTNTVPDNYVAYAVGGSKYANTKGGTFYNKATNFNTLNIEMCDTLRDGSYNVSAKTLANTIELVKEKMKQYNIPASRVIRHYDITGKECPKYYVDETKWKAFKDKLTEVQKPGAAVNNMQLYYRAHVQKHGTLPVVRDGQVAGTTAMSIRLEGFWVDLRTLRNTYPDLKLSGKVHIQKKGDITLNNIEHDIIIGSSGEGLRLEAFVLTLKGLPAGKKLYYRSHVQGIGWEDWKEAGEWSGTKNKSKRIEAIQIKIA